MSRTARIPGSVWIALLKNSRTATGEAFTARLELWDTAVRYQLVHAVALVALGAWRERVAGAALAWCAWGFVLGTVLFSGSLAALALGAPRMMGVVTPFGGLGLIAGWIALGVALGRRA